MNSREFSTAQKMSSSVCYLFFEAPTVTSSFASSIAIGSRFGLLA
jgi:hypothetical protein